MKHAYAHVTWPKPAKGSHDIARKLARKSIESTRKANKAKAKRRDGYRCRWPFCTCHTLKLRLESDHVVPLSLGGSDDTSNLFTACYVVHQGAHSLHSGDLEIRYLTPQGCDGICAFYDNGRLVAREKAIGVLEPRR